MGDHPVHHHPAGADDLQRLLDDAMLTTLDTGGTAERATIIGRVAREHSDVYLVCDRCRTTATPTVRMLFGHYVKTERAHRALNHITDGHNAGLHRPGDVRPATDAEYWAVRPTEAPHRRPVQVNA